MFLLKDTAEKAQKEIQALNLPDRMQIHFYIADSVSPYPINTLRNIAIDHVQTSHFWLTDMDMWPVRMSFPSLLISRNNILDHFITSSHIFGSRQVGCYHSCL